MSIYLHADLLLRLDPPSLSDHIVLCVYLAVPKLTFGYWVVLAELVSQGLLNLSPLLNHHHHCLGPDSHWISYIIILIHS